MLGVVARGAGYPGIKKNLKKAKRAIEDFQLKMCSQLYVRDSRILAGATPRKEQLISKYTFITDTVHVIGLL